MSHPFGRIFQLDRFAELPVWGQALIASRMARRLLLSDPALLEPARLASLVATCDAMDAAASDGSLGRERKRLVEEAMRWQPNAPLHHVSLSLAAACDAALAANASTDFGAAETACATSSWNAVAHAGDDPRIGALRVRIIVASDIDQVDFTCHEFHITRYDALTNDVLGRLAPARGFEELIDPASLRRPEDDYR